MAVKSEIKKVEKVWGLEFWIINEPEYCAKFLFIGQGAITSYHYHPKKKETFYGMEGQVALTIDGKDYMLNSFSRPKTIMPGTAHQLIGLAIDNVILEISTHHSDEDVVRLSESKPGQKSETAP